MHHVTKCAGDLWNMPIQCTQMSKASLRKSVKAVVAAITPASVAAQSEAITSVVSQLPHFVTSERVALYMSMDHEVQTAELIKHCFDEGKKVYLPRCEREATANRKQNHLRMLEVSSWRSVQLLEPRGKYHLREPEDGSEGFNDGLDIIIVPGVAFTKRCERIGYGAGFYDEFVNAYERAHGKRPFLVGVGFKEQLVEAIPTEPHDVVLDAVVLSNTIYKKLA